MHVGLTALPFMAHSHVCERAALEFSMPAVSCLRTAVSYLKVHHSIYLGDQLQLPKGWHANRQARVISRSCCCCAMTAKQPGPVHCLGEGQAGALGQHSTASTERSSLTQLPHLLSSTICTAACCIPGKQVASNSRRTGCCPAI